MRLPGDVVPQTDAVVVIEANYKVGWIKAMLRNEYRSVPLRFSMEQFDHLEDGQVLSPAPPVAAAGSADAQPNAVEHTQPESPDTAAVAVGAQPALAQPVAADALPDFCQWEPVKFRVW